MTMVFLFTQRRQSRFVVMLSHFGHAPPVTLAFRGPERFGAGTLSLVFAGTTCSEWS